ncbi:hypothetical protein B0H12DRAFT_1074750 [Mycena haematopus]|nr:hypothetical protein B0H12DRAFT_1074750 [Mycena haematopus]
MFALALLLIVPALCATPQSSLLRKTKLFLSFPSFAFVRASDDETKRDNRPEDEGDDVPVKSVDVTPGIFCYPAPDDAVPEFIASAYVNSSGTHCSPPRLSISQPRMPHDAMLCSKFSEFASADMNYCQRGVTELRVAAGTKTDANALV